MSGAVKRVAAGSAMALLVGLGASGPATAAGYGDEENCGGTAAPQNLHADNQAPEANADRVRTFAGTSVSIDVLANDSDVDGDRIYLAGTTTPRKGSTCINTDGTISYHASFSTRDYTDTFRYGITDGDRYRSATVTVQVEGVQLVKAQLKKRLLLKKNNQVKRKALIAYTNPNSIRVVVFAFDRKHDRTVATRTISPGKTISFSTKVRSLDYAIILPTGDGEASLVDFGRLNTRTGRQSVQSGDDSGFFRKMPDAAAVRARLAGR